MLREAYNRREYYNMPATYLHDKRAIIRKTFFFRSWCGERESYLKRISPPTKKHAKHCFRLRRKRTRSFRPLISYDLRELDRVCWMGSVRSSFNRSYTQVCLGETCMIGLVCTCSPREIFMIIRAKRVSNCYIQEKKNCPSARVHACSTNLGFSVEKIVLVLVWGTSERLVPAKKKQNAW